jgi:hypothetical protein
LNKNFIIGPIELECEDRTSDKASITVMICVPDYLDDRLLHRAMIDSLGQIEDSIFLKTIPSGRFAQIMHEGSYEDIEATKAKFDKEIMANGYTPIGALTEIIMTPMFFNDRCQIILRQRIE